MKYIRQLGIILLFSLAGDVCHGLLPFPIPASIYGMVLLLLALTCKLVKVEDVKQTGDFLVSLLPLLFMVPAVGLMACWEQIQSEILKMILLIAVTTVLTFGVSGLLTKLFHNGGEQDG